MELVLRSKQDENHYELCIDSQNGDMTMTFTSMDLKQVVVFTAEEEEWELIKDFVNEQIRNYKSRQKTTDIASTS